MDTTCSEILSVHKIDILTYGWPIHNLDGVHYLKNLDTLRVQGTPSDTAGQGLEQLTTLPLPIHLKSLTISSTKLSQLPPLSDTLLFLDCSSNKLSNLPNILPQNLTYLNCRANQLTQLPTLPSTLTSLWCDYNLLSSLPQLPANLVFLFCGANFHLSQPSLPVSLRSFGCWDNGWSVLPLLPNSLQSLYCSNNLLPSLPGLPDSLTLLYCDHNLLSSILALPNSLRYLFCDHNALSSITSLPSSLQQLYCNHNQLSTLPALPLSLKQIDCSYNQIVTLPELPDYMYFLDCSNNANLRCLPELKTMQCGTHPDGFGGHDPNVCLNFSGTAVSCVPDYGNISYSTPSVHWLPLCDSINPDNCTSYNYNSIRETASVHFNLFPNPCSDFVTINLFDSESTTLQLMDITGKEIANYSFNTPNFNLETSNLSAGIYFLKLSDSKGKSAVSKLIKQ